MGYEIKIFAGNGNKKLAEGIARSLGITLSECICSRFSDGEIWVQLQDNVRGCDVFVIQPTCPPVNDNTLELLFLIDALKRASARRITAVVPYYGYARQDRKTSPRTPISARVVADLLTTAGVHRILTVDLHAGQIQGFFDIPVDHLPSTPVLVDHLHSKDLQNPVVVAPDAGAVERARDLSHRLNAGLAIVDRRPTLEEAQSQCQIIGDVEGKDVVIIDDIIDTGGTLFTAVEACESLGARRILACVTHPVLTGPAIPRLENSSVEELVTTNSIPLTEDKRSPKIHVVSIALLLAEAIRRIHNEESVISLYTRAVRS